MNARIEKIVECLKGGKARRPRRDQVQKAIEENAFSYFIYKGYDEVYNVEPQKLPAELKSLESYWLNDGDFLIPQLLENGNKLVITIKYGYSYMSFWADLKEEVETVQEVKEEIKTESTTVPEAPEVQTTPETNTTDFTVSKDVHTKTNATIYVAKLNNKIEYAEFKNIESRIKSIGGYYSRFKKGFIFAEDPTELLKNNFSNAVNETINQTEQVKEVQKVEQEKIVIDENLARRNKENYSFTDYKEGSATAEYNQAVADATEQIEEAKKKVSEESQIKLDNLLNWYKKAYANWTNKHNSNGANHVSVAIAGASNYNMSKHNKWLSKEGKLWAEYEELKNISDKIDIIINSDKIIKSSDPNALEKLKEKLQHAEEEHKGYKDYNIKARKEGKEKLSSYVLQNSNARMKAIKDRIKKLERIAV